MWKKIEKVLLKIIPMIPSVHEKAFGLQPTNLKNTYPIILRNWLTFSLRHQIMLEERRAYKIQNYTLSSYSKFFTKFNYAVKSELKNKKLLYDQQGLSDKLEKIVTTGNIIATVVGGELQWKDVI